MVTKASSQPQDVAGRAKRVLQCAWDSYRANTTLKLQVIDSYAAFCILTACVLQGQACSVHTNEAAHMQHAYMMAVGSFPFNAYLAAVFACLGGAVLSICLRMQLDKTNTEVTQLAPERACADFILAHLVLLFAAWNYVG